MNLNSLLNKKIYVAGHKGMVGRSLCKTLKDFGIKKVLTASRSHLDLLDSNKVQKFIQYNKPDIVVNCAGRVGGIFANSTYPVEFLNQNILIQLNLINSSFKNNIKHFINLGSSCIYPKNSKQPIKEKYLLDSTLEKTNEAYALAKIIGLKACAYYNQQYKSNYLTLMPCNLYGPHDNFHGKNSHFVPALIKKFIEAKRKKKNSVEIWGSGSPKREVMYVDDLARAIVFVLNLKVKNDKNLKKHIKNDSLINVGSGNEYSVKRYAQIINKLSNSNKKLKFNKKCPDGTKRKVLDNLIMKKLGWKPITSLENGLITTIAWYNSNY